MSTTASSPAGVPRVYLAVPTHSNTITVEAAITALEFTQLAMQRGAVVQTVFYSASIISHLRNMIVADFLAGDFSHLFMLDADQGLPAPLIFKMLDSGYPVVGVLYPRRNFGWQQVDLQKAQRGVPDVLHQGLRFVGEPLLDATGQLTVANGLARARSVGTGALLIRRAALERMCTQYPELRGQGFPDEDENLPRAPHNWGFFNPLVQATDGRNAGEDIGFCQRWLDCGGEIWADFVTGTTHVGRFPFSGSYWEHLQALGRTATGREA